MLHNKNRTDTGPDNLLAPDLSTQHLPGMNAE